jgi:transcriptional regulator with XRE-family HTH domain
VHTSYPSSASDPSRPPLLTGLGQALRWLRERQSRKQYRVAHDAGITKGMLSAYETGRQRPSLETLDKLLETLGCDLNDLHNALQIVNGRPEQMKGWREAIPGAVRATPAAEMAQLAPGVPSAGFSGPTAGVPGAEPPTVASPGGPASSGRPEHSGTYDRPGAGRPWWRMPESFEVHEPTHLHDVLGRDQVRQAPLAAEEEEALSRMLDGFHSLLRYWHRSLAALTTGVGAAAPQGARLPAPPGPVPPPAPPSKAAGPAAPPRGAQQPGNTRQTGAPRHEARPGAVGAAREPQRESRPGTAGGTTRAGFARIGDTGTDPAKGGGSSGPGSRGSSKEP